MIWKFVAAGVSTIALFVGVYSLGSIHGKGEVQAEWNSAKISQQVAIQKIRDEYGVKEINNRLENQRISDDLVESKEAYAASIASIKSDYAKRLRDSENRASVYQRLSQGGPLEQADLASYATQFDRSLEEGRALVQEFSATLRQRENELRLLGDQILTDRKLLDINNGADPTVPTS